MDKTMTRLQEVFCDTFQRDDILITRDTTADDIEGWDSMMHVNLIINVKKVFKIRVDISEVAATRNVGQIVDLINSREKG